MGVGLGVARGRGEKFGGGPMALEDASFEQKKQGLRAGGGIAFWKWRRRHSGDWEWEWFIESAVEKIGERVGERLAESDRLRGKSTS